ncbi:MAG: DUF2339 domain-containing protein [Bacteroidetes bacterium]|nr:DUF2339 domain-containing protein [Bacteroidota bacterium]
MTEDTDLIDQLNNKLESLLKRQSGFLREIEELRDEINRLKILQNKAQHVVNEDVEIISSVERTIFDAEPGPVQPTVEQSPYPLPDKRPGYSSPPDEKPSVSKSDLEKFIGENLINKIGIAILIIGVGIGAKYSIEHQLISPLTRIILGYLMGFGLLGFGIKLKRDYSNFSAVLVSGAIAIMYFITYAAYSFYDLIPQGVAFALMVVFTASSVFAAIHYNRQVIAHIGLVGAYAVPFLLSEGSGKVAILFTYISIINIGILAIAVRKYWKPLYYASFLLSWLIFFTWYQASYQAGEHFVLSLFFLTVFFITFYLVFLAHKLVQKIPFEITDIVLLISNSFIFYGIGYAVLQTSPTGQHFLGLFTLCNALIHLVVCIIIYNQRLADRNLFYLVAGLALVFITIAIPVQLNGYWVTLLWVFEAALLFGIGRYSKVPFYEWLSYPLMFLSFFCLVRDWILTYYIYDTVGPGGGFIPFININFLTAALFIAAFSFINYVNIRYVASSPIPEKFVQSFVAFSIPSILLIVLYYTFRLEISAYFDQLFQHSSIEVKNNGSGYPETGWNFDLTKYKTIWIINYSLFFLSILSFINIKKISSKDLGIINLVFNALAVVVFLTQGLYVLSELRDSYLYQTHSASHTSSLFNIGIRYISFMFTGLLLFLSYRYLHERFLRPFSVRMKVPFDFLLYTSVIWIVSSELITWSDMLGYTQFYKLGLSILWGVYALLLIALGIWKQKKHLRVGAIVLFSVTLLKLFFYDISQLDTIGKTIVFVSLGLLLLIISFLYNKYKHLIW